MTILILFFLLQTKHLIIDWCWQPSYEFLNKGIYGHWGGIRHALKNAIGTGLCIWICTTWWPAFILGILDFILHYHIDWAKVNLNKRAGWGPLTHKEFWWLTGADQYLHQVTYILIVFLLILP